DHLLEDDPGAGADSRARTRATARCGLRRQAVRVAVRGAGVPLPGSRSAQLTVPRIASARRPRALGGVAVPRRRVRYRARTVDADLPSRAAGDAARGESRARARRGAAARVHADGPAPRRAAGLLPLHALWREIPARAGRIRGGRVRAD